eukprot:3403126-Amphidinium_carterae.3
MTEGDNGASALDRLKSGWKGVQQYGDRDQSYDEISLVNCKQVSMGQRCAPMHRSIPLAMAHSATIVLSQQQHATSGFAKSVSSALEGDETGSKATSQSEGGLLLSSNQHQRLLVTVVWCACWQRQLLSTARQWRRLEPQSTCHKDRRFLRCSAAGRE